MDETPGIVLAVYAHPDDADVACGGIPGPLGQGGERRASGRVHRRRQGDDGPNRRAGELAAERAAELEASSALIGLSSVENLGFLDGELTDSDDFRRTLVERVRGFRPEVVCGHDPTAVFFGQSYFNHRDHRIAGAALLDAVAPAAALPHYFPGAGPPHQVPTVLLSATLEPDEWVDVSDTIETKASAVECHRTQFAGQDGWAGEAVRRRAAEEGRRAGVAYAEGFRRLTLGD